MPPDPLPSRFSDWSSLGLPRTGTSPHIVSAIRMEQNENIQNPLNVPSAVVTRQEGIRTSSPEEVHISPPTDQQREELSAPAMEEAPAPLPVEVEIQRNEVEPNEDNKNDVPPISISGSVRPPLNVDDLILDPVVQQEAGHDSTASGGSHVRIQDTNMREIPSTIPLERLTLRRDRMMMSEDINLVQHHTHERTNSHIPSTYTRRNYSEDSSNDHGSSRE